ncbi:UNKNOWN [Stylonychia lemnae]|uniref:Chloride channel protein n=1 Tax=Stylonychia lemnae TaxID=5949 RepID=A0A078A2K5_STYLE|nr:UNKNOWN [Stylonychia lemnae]|eukprot:CDW75014.1 UNKNOWN [Stylonychia lemnae]
MRSRTLAIYPRPDQEFKKRESLDFQLQRSAIYKTRPHGKLIHFYKWLSYFLCGAITGIVCYGWEWLVEEFVKLKWKATQPVLLDDSIGLGYLVYIGISILFGAAASLLTLYLEPLAAGGGTTEMMGYFNGVNYPGVFSVKTLIVKIFGLMFAIAAGLCIGKEGVLAHIGSIIGYLLIYAPFGFMKYFRNNEDKRDMAAAGTAAGVAAAFGSPIGGTMFAYEVAAPTVFWSFELTWVLFFTSAVSCFFVNILASLVEGKGFGEITNSGVIKFGSYINDKYQLYDLISFGIMGVIGGVLGAIFCFVNYTMGKLRKKYLTSNLRKFGETMFYVIVTGTLMYFAPLLVQDECYDVDVTNPTSEDYNEISKKFQRYLCPDGKYSPLGTALFNPLGSVFKIFMNGDTQFGFGSLALYLIIWYPMTIFSYGTNIPAGLFVSGILIGCGYGRLFGLFVSSYITSNVKPSSYAVVGAASILSGYARHTFSLAIIMMESTENIDLFIPIVFAIMVGYVVGGVFQKSIYINAVRFKNIPFLIETIPQGSSHIRAEDMMKAPVSMFHFKAPVKEVAEVLSKTSYNGFPVINTAKKLIGIISRDYLMVLLKNKVFAGEFRKDDYSNFNSSQRHSLNSEYVKEKKTLSRQTLDGLDKDSRKKLILSHIDNEEDEDVDIDLHDIKDSLPVTWEDFNHKFNDAPPSFNEVKDVCDQNMDKKMDLRCYMEHSPHFVQPQDSAQKVLDVFRLHHLRYLPVVDKDQVIGIITRQDLFTYMSII